MEKWREFSGGGNDIWVFLKKGKHHPPTHRAEQEEPSRAEQEAGHQAWQKAGGRRSRRQQVRDGADRYIYFPLEIISIVRYRPYQIANQK